jgi:hypothetical protein
MPAKYRKNAEETKKARQLEIEIRAHTRVLSDPDASSLKITRAKTALRKAEAEKVALEKAVQNRCEQGWQETELQKIQKKCPESAPAALSALQDALYSLGAELKFETAKQYLNSRIKTVQTIINDDAADKRAAQRQIEEQRENADFVACEKARKEIYDFARPYFLKPRSLKSRQQAKEIFLEKAGQWKQIAKARPEDALDETGAHQKAVALAYAEVFARLAERVDIFEFDVEWQPTDEQMTKDRWFYELPVEGNWTFRSANDKASEEQARLRVALLRWYQHCGYSTDPIPVVPFPTKIPRNLGSRPVPLEFGAVREAERRAKQEERRFAQIEKLRIEDPAAFKKLTAEALKPVEIEDAPIVYYVQRRTLDNPHLSDVLYWSSGAEAVVGKDLHWDFNKKQYYVEDIAVEWSGPSQKAQRSDADLEIENQISAAKDLEPWNAHIVQKPRPIVPKNPVEKSATPFYRQPVKVIQGDHMPDLADPRHPKNGGEFRHGAFYTKEQCVETDKQAGLYGTRIFDGVVNSETVTAAVKADIPIRSSAVWAEWEAKTRQGGKTGGVSL